MPVITQFGGIYPRVSDHLLTGEAATIAHNVKLRNGRIESWREKLNVGFGVEDAISLHVKGCCYLTWDSCVTVADFLPDWGRLYITGRNDQPEFFTLTNCQPTYYNLGVPTPIQAPIVSGSQSDGRSSSARSYMYTYVNIFGEESAPSPISQSLTVADGAAVSISGMASAPLGYGIDSIRIYRSATAFRTGEEKEQQPLTGFLLVAVVDATATTYTDTVLEMHLGPANNTLEVRMPPKRLRQIRYVESSSILAGVTNNEVHFSEPFEPYNWPAVNDMTLPYNIVNMVVVDSHVIVSTDGYPFVINADDDRQVRQCRAAGAVDIPLPDIGCGYPNSAIATPFGMVYSSKDGLVLVAPNASFQIITANWFSTDDWAQVYPASVRLAYWRGYIICITDAVSFMLEIDGQTYGDYQLGSLTTISDVPDDMFVTTTGELLMLEDRFISQWNAGDKLRPYEWVSRELTFGGESSPTTLKIRTNGTMFKLIAPNGSAIQRMILNEEPVRLRRIGRHLNYKISLEGTGTVEFLALGMTKTTVNAGR